VVVHVCNSRYSGGRSKKITYLRIEWAKVEQPSLKNKIKKMNEIKRADGTWLKW
jgi:hypothetical protein